MKYKFNNKEINIPDADIKNYMKTLDLTEEEAIEMYLDDEGYTENDEVEELTKKAKENKTTLIHAQADKRERKPREAAPKEDKVKEDIIKVLQEALSKQDNLKDIKITNKGKIIEFDLSDNSESFKLDLIRRRKKKDE